ncbi:MAG: phosphoribosyltransferase family protein [Acidobacteriota bacterium]
MDKVFIQEEDLLLDSFRLGVKIFEQGFRPDFIVGIWRGGSSVGIYVQECLQTLGVETDHISIRTSYQDAPETVPSHARPIRVHGTKYLLENLNADDGLLIVDDIYGSGRTIEAVIEKVSKRTKRNMPRDVRIAVPWYKPDHNRTERVPDFYLHATDKWLVLPYELKGLSRDEIAQHKPFLRPILDSVQR